MIDNYNIKLNHSRKPMSNEFRFLGLTIPNLATPPLLWVWSFHTSVNNKDETRWQGDKKIDVVSKESILLRNLEKTKRIIVLGQK